MIAAAPIVNKPEAPAASLPAVRPWRTALLTPLLVIPAVVAIAAWFDAPGLFRSAAGAVFLLMLLVCVVTDLRSRRIYNWATYTAALWAVLLLAVAALLPADRTIEWLGRVEPARLWIARIDSVDALFGFGVAFGIMFFLFSTFGCGGGDLKLLAASGLFLGPERVLEGLIDSYIVAGVAALCFVIWVVGPLAVFAAIVRSATEKIGLPLLFLGPQRDLRPFLKLGMPMAPFYAIGLLTAVYFRPL